jgi:hypothetical protein
MTGTSSTVKLNNIETQVISIREVLDRLDVCVIRGNGKPPLMERMSAVEKCVTNHQEDHKQRNEYWSKVSLLAIGMIVTNLGVMIFALLK